MLSNHLRVCLVGEMLNRLERALVLCEFVHHPGRKTAVAALSDSEAGCRFYRVQKTTGIGSRTES